MSEIYTISHYDDITEFKFNSPPELKDLLETAPEYANPEMKRNRLWDFSCGFSFSTEELQKISQAGEVLVVPENSKVAILASDDLSYGITRIYSALRNESLGRFQIFRGREEALAWLNESSEEN